MDFFNHQEQARKQTGKLILLFALAVLGIIAGIYFVASSAFAVAAAKSGAAETSWLNLELLGLVAGGTLLVVGGGSLYKTAQLRAGGHVVAEQIGGREVQPNTSDELERRLINVIEEISVASGTAMPGIYIMDGEPGINAFAAGFSPSDAVVGVTRGCLEQLSRDELQGVIAHEFSHIINGDMRLNIRLMGVLHGILCIALAGYLILRSGAGFRSRGNKGNGGGILGLSIALIAIGYVGMFFARLIQAAVSRQREFLADASAVQFTRNPNGISGALKKIGGFVEGAKVQHGQAQATSHMFFGNAIGASFMTALATHPPLEERIKRIDGSTRGLERAEAGPGTTTGPAHAGAAGFAGAAGPRPSPKDLVDQTGTPTEAHLLQTRELLGGLPLAITAALHEPFSARALVYALLLSRDRSERKQQLSALQNMCDATTVHETVELASATADLDPTARLPLVDLTLPALRQLSSKQFQQFAQAFTALIQADGKLEIFEFALHRVLMRHLSTTFIKLPPTRVVHTKLATLMVDVRVLLSQLARGGHEGDESIASAYAAGIAALPESENRAVLSATDCRLELLDPVLDRLAQASPSIKKVVLRACAETVAHDGELTAEEAELLRAISDALDCPMPPVLIHR